LIKSFHPISTRGRYDPLGLPITAPNAEAARRHIIDDMARREELEGDPVKEFGAALNDKNVGQAMTILNQTWFGVPESTQCWKLEGFAEAVALLDDPPEEEGGTAAG
jgi:hypothetical protein